MLEQTPGRKRSGTAVVLSFGVAIGALAAAPAAAGVTIEVLGTYAQPDREAAFDQAAAEVAAYDPGSKQLFVVNNFEVTVDILDISNPAAPSLVHQIDITPYGASPNSVAVSHGVVAVAVEADPPTDPGSVVFFDLDGDYINDVPVGSAPDMVTFTPFASRLLVANEGYASDDYSIDPLGTVSVIDMTEGPAAVTPAHVTTIDFSAFNRRRLDDSVRIFGPGATVAQDLEPEYITLVPFSPYAYVSFQENNAIGTVNFLSGRALDLFGLGFKDYSEGDNRLDPSDRDGPDGDPAINIDNWPVFGMYLPDGLAAYRTGWPPRTFIVTANEGDDRKQEVFGPDGVPEEARVGDVVLDPDAFPDAAALQEDANLGRLKISIAQGDADGDGDMDGLYNFGARSFSIYDAQTGEQVFDSADQFAQITAERFPDFFNTNDDDNELDSRSDDQGVEPSNVVIGRVALRPIAFITLERIGGIMIYDVTDPRSPRFCDYVNNRDFSVNPIEAGAGDLRPEGILFIPWWESPILRPMVVVANELSGTVTTYEVVHSPGACGEDEIAAGF